MRPTAGSAARARFASRRRYGSFAGHCPQPDGLPGRRPTAGGPPILPPSISEPDRTAEPRRRCRYPARPTLATKRRQAARTQTGTAASGKRPAKKPAARNLPVRKSAPKNASATKTARSKKVGVWLFGAYGGLATTLVVGTRAMARGLADTRGLTTESDVARDIPFRPIDTFVFGGHEIRSSDFAQAAAEIGEQTGTLSTELLRKLKRDLLAQSKNVVEGYAPNAGATIEKLRSGKKPKPLSLRTQAARIERDIKAFQKKHRLERVICVNLTSTEPLLRLGAAHKSIEAFERALDDDRQKAVRPSALYAYVAAKLGMPFVHFTPSNSALTPAIEQLFAKNNTPFMGCDGKTGETLVKSALAPMFLYRNLKVLSWQGYNMLGDRDGVVLADGENKRSKVESKDGLLPSILGYPLHTHVAIDYVPSLHDLKTAWDFIHFEGFLGFKMSLQFTWQGCDAILAAPLVLDLIRFADLAATRGEGGPMPHLACFFKAPFGVDEHDLHRQWQMLGDYLDGVRGGADAAKTVEGPLHDSANDSAKTRKPIKPRNPVKPRNPRTARPKKAKRS
ncbi:MAG: inositol-3-phosphate synthase [Planctomycetota bacterium]